MENLFSHPRQESPQATEDVQSLQEPVTAIFMSLDLPLAEVWLAFTEYTHLWWPMSLKRDPESFLECGEKYLMEEDGDNQQHILGETQFFVPEDLIALQIHQGELEGVFQTGLSFVFDAENEDSTIVEICSGLVKPRDLGDSPLGVMKEDKETAQTLLGGFARFMKTELVIE